MAKIRLTKKFSFEMAHALIHHDGLCRNLHGHSYKLHVTIQGTITHNGIDTEQGTMVDFAKIKQIVNDCIISKYDHALVLDEHIPVELLRSLQKQFERIIVMPCQPTVENLLSQFVQLLKNKFSQGVSLYSVLLQETENSFAEWIEE